MKWFLMLSTASLFAMIACGGTDGAANPAEGEQGSELEGAWRVVEITTNEPGVTALIEPPSLYIFSGAHYSMMHVQGAQPRPGFVGIIPTDDERAAAYRTFIANSGSFQVNGDILNVRPIVAKHPNFMGGGSQQYQFRLSADTLWLTDRAATLRYVLNGQIVPTPDSTSESLMKLVRLR
jgi:hypothetical protein